MMFLVVCCVLLASNQFVASVEIPESTREEMTDLRNMIFRMSFIVQDIIDKLPPRSGVGPGDGSVTEITPTSFKFRWNRVTLVWDQLPYAIGYDVSLITDTGEKPSDRLGRYDTTYTTTDIIPGMGYRIRVTPIMTRGRGEAFTTDYFVPECPATCPKDDVPVCGTNGQTYSHKCLLETAQCAQGDRESTSGLQLDYEGECVPCANVLCDTIQCPDGFVLGDETLPGECCPECVDQCSMVVCETIVCEPGYVTRNHQGECCPRCAPDAFRDCSDALAQGMVESGVYMIQPEGIPAPVSVFCDMEAFGGGWTVILRRMNSTVSFFRMYEDYVTGFGDLDGAHWIGLELLYRLGSQGNVGLFVTGTDRIGAVANGTYNNFHITGAEDGYRLKSASGFSGEIGNALNYNRGHQFSAQDVDRDTNEARDCANELVGGWWYRGDMCARANPMGEYLLLPDFGFEKGIFWSPFRGKSHSLPFLEMKIRTV